MLSSPDRVRLIARWVGVVLAFPFIAVGGVAFVWWLRGEFPATVTVDTVSLVLALLIAGAIIVYAICWGAGRLIAARIARA